MLQRGEHSRALLSNDEVEKRKQNEPVQEIDAVSD